MNDSSHHSIGFCSSGVGRRDLRENDGIIPSIAHTRQLNVDFSPSTLINSEFDRISRRQHQRPHYLTYFDHVSKTEISPWHKFAVLFLMYYPVMKSDEVKNVIDVYSSDVDVRHVSLYELVER